MTDVRKIGWLTVLAFAGCVSFTAVDDRVLILNEDGLKMFAQGSYRDARESFEAALELSPHDADLVFNLGQCQDRLGNYAQAEQYYVQCLQLAAGHVEARYALGSLYYRTNRRPLCVRLTEEWLIEQPKLADPYALDGWRLRQEQDHPAAQGRLQQALALDPQNVHALVEMAILYEAMGRPDRSLALYERALARNPRQPEIALRAQELKASNVGRPLPD